MENMRDAIAKKESENKKETETMDENCKRKYEKKSIYYHYQCLCHAHEERLIGFLIPCA